MVFYRRNTVSDKVLSLLGMMLAILLLYNMVEAYQATGYISLVDALVAAISLGVGILFLYTSRLKYMEITEDTFVWYTWFWCKHTLKQSEMKGLSAKQRYFIISRHGKGDVWVSRNYIRETDEPIVIERLKALIGG